jgi:hypothetical protein
MIQQRVISPTRFLERKGARGFPPRALLGCMHLFAIEIRMRGYRWLGRFAAHFAYRDILEKEGRPDKRNRHRPFVAERGQAHIALWADVDGEHVLVFRSRHAAAFKPVSCMPWMSSSRPSGKTS